MTLPKFIITMDGYFRLGMVNQHKDLLKPGDSCLGGGIVASNWFISMMMTVSLMSARNCKLNTMTDFYYCHCYSIFSSISARPSRTLSKERTALVMSSLNLLWSLRKSALPPEITSSSSWFISSANEAMAISMSSFCQSSVE